MMQKLLKNMHWVSLSVFLGVSVVKIVYAIGAIVDDRCNLIKNGSTDPTKWKCRNLQNAKCKDPAKLCALRDGQAQVIGPDGKPKLCKYKVCGCPDEIPLQAANMTMDEALAADATCTDMYTADPMPTPTTLMGTVAY